MSKEQQHSRILFIIDYYKPHIGGLEVVFENIINRLLKRGYKIGIITTHHMQTLPRFERQGNLQIWRVGKTRNQLLWYALVQGLRIAPQFDQIHTTTYAGAIPASVIGILRKKPVLITIHEVFGPLRHKFKKKGWIYRLFEWLIFKFPYTSYVCVSNYTQTMVSKLYNINIEKLQVIYNGVDQKVWSIKSVEQETIKSFKKIHQLDNKLVAVYYGHSGISKGLDDLLIAMPYIIKHIPNFHAILNIIPTKRDYKILRLINTLGINQHILLLHGLMQQQLVTIVSAADVAIVPSISEGFGLVAAEVSQLGKPIIVTKNGALPEVVCGDVIFIDNTHPETILSALKKVQTQQRASIPKKVFEWEETVNQYEQLYYQHQIQRYQKN